MRCANIDLDYPRPLFWILPKTQPLRFIRACLWVIKRLHGIARRCQHSSSTGVGLWGSGFRVVAQVCAGACLAPSSGQALGTTGGWRAERFTSLRFLALLGFKLVGFSMDSLYACRTFWWFRVVDTEK